MLSPVWPDTFGILRRSKDYELPLTQVLFFVRWSIKDIWSGKPGVTLEHVVPS